MKIIPCLYQLKAKVEVRKNRTSPKKTTMKVRCPSSTKVRPNPKFFFHCQVHWALRSLHTPYNTSDAATKDPFFPCSYWIAVSQWSFVERNTSSGNLSPSEKHPLRTFQIGHHQRCRYYEKYLLGIRIICLKSMIIYHRVYESTDFR